MNKYQTVIRLDFIAVDDPAAREIHQFMMKQLIGLAPDNRLVICGNEATIKLQRIYEDKIPRAVKLP